MTVGVVGLGIAGLRAASLLERGGFKVELFEARQRAGGRLLTFDDGGGLRCEAGGEWMEPEHLRCLALMQEIGVEPDVRGNWPRTIFCNGARCTEDLLWADALEDELRIEAAASEESRNLSQPVWTNLQASEFDGSSVDDFLREQTQSERGLWWVRAKVRDSIGEDPDRTCVLAWLAGYVRHRGRDTGEPSGFRFPGGASTIAQTLVRSLRSEPHYGEYLSRVTQGKGKVSLSFGDRVITVDRVVVTLPPRSLERIVFEPALSPSKRCAIEACDMGRAIRIVWAFGKPWWKDEGWSGSLVCDGPLQRVSDCTLGDLPALGATIYGDDATRWRELGDPVRAGLYELCELFPAAKAHFLRGLVFDWIGEPLSRGGASNQAPGYVLEHQRHISPPENLIHFAGEHTAENTGTIEGALESAERVVSEIMAAAARG